MRRRKHFKQTTFDKIWDILFPRFSFRCKHKIIRIHGLWRCPFWCSRCEIYVPEINAVSRTWIR